MIAHELKIGQRIFDTHDNRWGEILLIGGKNEDAFVEEEDTIVLYKPEDSNGECETLARDAYPIEPNKYFRGEEVCTEINRDVFDDEHNYEYYCPIFDVNCWDFEISEK